MSYKLIAVVFPFPIMQNGILAVQVMNCMSSLIYITSDVPDIYKSQSDFYENRNSNQCNCIVFFFTFLLVASITYNSI